MPTCSECTFIFFDARTLCYMYSLAKQPLSNVARKVIFGMWRSWRGWKSLFPWWKRWTIPQGQQAPGQRTEGTEVYWRHGSVLKARKRTEGTEVYWRHGSVLKARKCTEGTEAYWRHGSVLAESQLSSIIRSHWGAKKELVLRLILGLYWLVQLYGKYTLSTCMQVERRFKGGYNAFMQYHYTWCVLSSSLIFPGVCMHAHTQSAETTD